MKRTFLLMLLCAGIVTAQTVTVTVQWALGTGGQATSFIFQRAQAVIGPTLTYATIATVPAPSSCASLTGTLVTCTIVYKDVASATNVMAVGDVFYYQVMANNGAGSSPPSSATSVAISAPPTPLATLPVAPSMVGAMVTYP
jgi:hypothetical protein